MSGARRFEKREGVVKEKPILFNTPMVLALLDGRKTQTRRVVKLSPMSNEHVTDALQGVPCPYASTGNDGLWVREAWRTEELPETLVDGVRFFADKAFIPIRSTREAADLWVAAHDNGRLGSHWRPSIFMPRWASRITLEITGVRVERVQEITEEDAIAEGFESRVALKQLWNEINEERGFGWKANPWVWAISFRVVRERVGR